MNELSNFQFPLPPDPSVGVPPRCAANAVDLLLEARRDMTPPQWREFATTCFRAHPAFPFLCEEPCAAYSFRKPRGYAGDAVLLDLLYGGASSAPLIQAASETGRELYRQTSRLPTPLAIRHRRDYLARRLGDLCTRGGRSRVLSVACGHLREAASLLERDTWPERLVALDQDARSLAVVQKEYAGRAVECLNMSALRLLSPRLDLGEFDFIYSAGLTDYLEDEFVERLIAALARRLAPGGRLLICNMTPETCGAAYMEAVMDWWLIYRTPAEMEKLAASTGLPWGVFVSQDRHVVYLELRRGR